MTERVRVRRKADRGRYERDVVDEVLDEALVCHVGFVVDGDPVVIPTIHARVGDTVYLHGATGNRMLRTLAAGGPVCVTATLVDGLVLARSWFHHSMNYRSVVVMGVAEPVTDRDEKWTALEAIVEHVARGRAAESREPTDAELRATLVVKLPLDECSAKVRTGGPIDDAEDLLLDVWAGVLPLSTVAAPAEPDTLLSDPSMPVAASVTGWRR